MEVICKTANAWICLLVFCGLSGRCWAISGPLNLKALYDGQGHAATNYSSLGLRRWLRPTSVLRIASIKMAFDYHRMRTDEQGRLRFVPDSPLHVLAEEITSIFGSPGYEIIVPEDNNYGLISNGPFNYSTPGLNKCPSNFTGTIRLLECGLADIGLGKYSLLSDRDEVVDYTRVIGADHWTLLGKAPYYRARSGGAISPFSLEVWMSILLALFCMGNLIYLFGSLADAQQKRTSRVQEGVKVASAIIHRDPPEGSLPNSCEPPHRPTSRPGTAAMKPDQNGSSSKASRSSDWVRDTNNVGVAGASLHVVSALLNMGSMLEPKSDSLRILCVAWWLATQILASFYTAQLTVHLTLLEQNMKISTVDDLKKSPYPPTKWLAPLGGGYETMVKTDPSLSFLLDDVRTGKGQFFNFFEEGSKRILTEENTYLLLDQDTAEKEVLKDHLKNLGDDESPGVEHHLPCRYWFIQDFNLKSVPFALVVQKGLPDLMEAANKAIGDLSSNGILTHLLKKDAPTNLGKLCKVSKNKTLGLEDYYDAFLLLLIGFTLSFAFLIVELGALVLIWRRQKHRLGKVI